MGEAHLLCFDCGLIQLSTFFLFFFRLVTVLSTSAVKTKHIGTSRRGLLSFRPRMSTAAAISVSPTVFVFSDTNEC
jgi:hypothetical protein